MLQFSLVRVNLIVWFLFAVNICTYGQNLIAIKCSDGKWGFKDINGSVVITCKYDYVGSFSEGLARVKLNNKWGYIDLTGKEVIPIKHDFSEIKNNKHKNLLKFYEREMEAELERKKEEQLKRKSFSYFSKEYIDKWLQKGEFERTADWQQRISDDNRKAKEAELLKEAAQVFIAEHSKNTPVGNIMLGAYDADKEVFLITNSVHGNWSEIVPINEAPDFKNNWQNIVKTPQYIIINDQIAFAGYKYAPIEVVVIDENDTQEIINPITTNTIRTENTEKSSPQNYSFCMKRNSEELLAEMQVNNYSLYRQYGAGLKMAKTGRKLMNIGAISTIGGLGFWIWGIKNHNGDVGVLGIGLVSIGLAVETVGVPIRTVGNKRKNIAQRIYCTQQSISMQPKPYFKLNLSPNRVGFAYMF